MVSSVRCFKPLLQSVWIINRRGAFLPGKFTKLNFDRNDRKKALRIAAGSISHSRETVIIIKVFNHMNGFCWFTV